jgi:hypothetical protein
MRSQIIIDSATVSAGYFTSSDETIWADRAASRWGILGELPRRDLVDGSQTTCRAHLLLNNLALFRRNRSYEGQPKLNLPT